MSQIYLKNGNQRSVQHENGTDVKPNRNDFTAKMWQKKIVKRHQLKYLKHY